MRRRRFATLALGALAATACRRGVPSTVAPAFAPTRAAASPPAEAEAEPEREDDPYAALAGFCDGVAPPGGSELAERVQRVRAALAPAGVRALVVEPGPNMQYLAGVHWGRSERPFLAVLSERRLAWVCPAFEERTAREQLGPDADVRTWREHDDPFASVAAIVGGGRAPVAVDPDARGFVFAGIRRHLGARMDGSPVVGARLRKTPTELSRLRRANEATKAALALASTRVQPGMKQSEVADEIRRAQEAAGLRDVWVLALSGPAASFPHGTREDRTLSRGDLVLVDTGGALAGYRSDISRTWALSPRPTGAGGPVYDEARRIWDTVVAAQAAALEAIRPGRPCAEPDAVARKVIAAAGFGEGYESFTHRLGHGIGLQVHEPPYLRRDNPQILEPGMTMSNEPGIYRPGVLGVRIEDIVAVTDGPAEVFGASIGSFDDPFAGHVGPKIGEERTR
jgi:Xaa-Pro dipeptidase